MKTISFISLFDQPLKAYWTTSIMAKAQAIGAVSFQLIDLRQFGLGDRLQVDDSPYGGGGGMVLRIEPLVAALESVKARASRRLTVVLLTPRGVSFDQARAQALADQPADLVLIGGHYSGYDERLVDYVDQQLAIGSYILTNSILPGLVVTDALVRLLPGVLGKVDNSRSAGTLNRSDLVEDYPHYTRPASFRGRPVPEVLMSGNHQQINHWRRQFRNR